MIVIAVVAGLAVAALLGPFLVQFGCPFWPRLFAIVALAVLIGWIPTHLLSRFRGPPGDNSRFVL